MLVLFPVVELLLLTDPLGKPHHKIGEQVSVIDAIAASHD
jgi:hypothetical protein